MAEAETLVKSQLLTSMASMLCKEGDAVTRARNRVTILHQALQFNVECVVDILLDEDVSVTEKDEKCYSALYYAVMSNSVRMIGKILHKGVAVDERQGTSSTVLHFAIQKKLFSSVRFLLEKGANVNLKDENSCRGNSALYYAIKTGLSPLVNMIIEKGANLNDEFECKRKSPVHVSVENNFVDIVNLLLEKGADPNKLDLFGSVPLIYAVASNSLDIAKALLNHGAKLEANQWKDETILHRAATVSVDMVKLLIDRGVEVDSVDKMGETPLFRASDHRLEEVVEALLDKGANVNHRDHKERTALHHAGSGDVVDLLVEKGAVVNAKDFGGDTPLMLCLLHNKPNAIEALLRAGSEVDIRNKSGQNFLLVYHNLDSNNNLYRAATEYIIKLQMAHLDQELTSKFHFKKPNSSNFQETCSSELNKLKRSVFGRDSLFNVLTVKNNDGSILKNDTLITMIKSESLESTFPIYSGLLKRSLKRVEKLNSLKNSAKLNATITVGNKTITLNLPNDITNQLFESLSEDVIKNFV